MTLVPGSPEWAKLVTASKVAAILGHSPFESQRSMYHIMRGEYVPAVTDAMRRGHYLEQGVLDWWLDGHADEFVSMPPGNQEYALQPSYPLGDWAAATPDMSATLGTGGEETWRRVLVEAKTSANDDEWGRPGTDEIPTHYLTQVYFSMHVSGIHEIRVPVLTSRLVFAEYVVEHDVEVGKLLEARCKAFFDALWSDPPPPLDDSLATFECMRQIHPDIEPGLTVEVPRVPAWDLACAAVDMKDAERLDRRARSELLDLAGRAQYLTCGGVTVARRQPSPNGGVSLVRLIKTPLELTDGNAA